MLPTNEPLIFRVKRQFTDTQGTLHHGDIPTAERAKTWKNANALHNAGYIEIYSRGDTAEDTSAAASSEYKRGPGRPKKEQ
jgi:hypothetical protein